MEGTHTMPESAAPPTPPVELSALLAREELALRQIAGPPAAGTVVHWVHTSEMADPYPYLLGGELLLTAGVHIPEATGSETYFDDYVSRIVAAGGAALGFGVAPVHDTVPRALVEACEAHGLPLLEVPPQTTFSGVARAVWQLMSRARLAELRRVTEAQQSLASAASRPDPVPSVLRRLAQRLGGRAVLYGPEGAELAGAGREPGGEVRAALARLAEVVQPDRQGLPADGAPRSGSGSLDHPAGTRPGEAEAARPHAGHRPGREIGQPGPASTAGPSPANRPASATDTVSGAHLAVYALGAGHGFVLGVATPHRAPGDHTIASVAAVLLSLLTGEQHSGTGAARSAALVRLLLGAPPEEVAPLLGGERWLVVHARPDGNGAPDPVAASALGAALGSALVDPAGDVVRVLVPADREPAPLPGWTLGVSAAVTPADWPAADTQAARALARARATRTPLLRHGPRPALADLVPPGEATAHARALLAPVTAHPALTETLRAWLSLHGSWDRTAVALSVHRNTVRQRIARCAALLETDLDDPDVRMELWFALRHV
ncbi:PucR family transcriptional regulator ligand-binding domain-containing protein [Streptomyces sp. Go-475]|uniref:PucR family transcriptional regulator ligand-binding domain-containing protein n=1 Tax=Streptomyces sp. Go-475 TaxID=2072505 RepID=UPI000DEF6571|nr:PucR family transcriptional regulator ligand-binding domain-containing protein [Streptomyces sp. Go-475]AXE86098.1 Purine catabolism regulatory protein-like family protein [Streptomyces sp. Go-475]